MRVQQFYVWIDWDLHQDLNNCKENCGLRNNCHMQLINILDNEWPDALANLVTDPVSCPLDKEHCRVQVEKIILNW